MSEPGERRRVGSFDFGQMPPKVFHEEAEMLQFVEGFAEVSFCDRKSFHAMEAHEFFATPADLPAGWVLGESTGMNER